LWILTGRKKVVHKIECNFAANIKQMCTQHRETKTRGLTVDCFIWILVWIFRFFF
jgi:hypothetical protein